MTLADPLSPIERLNLKTSPPVHRLIAAGLERNSFLEDLPAEIACQSKKTSRTS